MYRIGITFTDGSIEAENFCTKGGCEIWLLERAEKKSVKKAIIVDKDNINDREIINFDGE